MDGEETRSKIRGCSEGSEETCVYYRVYFEMQCTALQYARCSPSCSASVEVPCEMYISHRVVTTQVAHWEKLGTGDN